MTSIRVYKTFNLFNFVSHNQDYAILPGLYFFFKEQRGLDQCYILEGTNIGESIAYMEFLHNRKNIRIINDNNDLIDTGEEE